MTRIDMYRNVHKGQRARLFALAVELGRADHDDGAAIASLATRLREAIMELRQHARNEETYIHPLLQARAPEVAADLEREHHSVETALTEVEDKLRHIDQPEGDRMGAGVELYRAWCRMLSDYLTHLDNEERLAMPALWDTCSDYEILAMIRRFVASRTLADQLDDLRSQVPALTPHERAALVVGMMRNGAIPAEPLWASLASVLPSNDVARLRADIAVA
jgi:iron-sulfur cluster repair protein YtfE (RIC family)